MRCSIQMSNTVVITAWRMLACAALSIHTPEFLHPSRYASIPLEIFPMLLFWHRLWYRFGYYHPRCRWRSDDIIELRQHLSGDTWWLFPLNSWLPNDNAFANKPELLDHSTGIQLHSPWFWQTFLGYSDQQLSSLYEDGFSSDLVVTMPDPRGKHGMFSCPRPSTGSSQETSMLGSHKSDGSALSFLHYTNLVASYCNQGLTATAAIGMSLLATESNVLPSGWHSPCYPPSRVAASWFEKELERTEPTQMVPVVG